MNIPTENKNPEMQQGMMAHLYNPSTWELEMSVLATQQGISKKGGRGQESRMIYHSYWQAMYIVYKNMNELYPQKYLVIHV